MKNCEKYVKAIAHDILCAQNEGNSDVLFNHMPGGEDIFGRYDEKELLDIADWLLEDDGECSEKKYIVRLGLSFIGEERHFGWLGARRVLQKGGYVIVGSLSEAVPVRESEIPALRESFGTKEVRDIYGEIELYEYPES